MASSFLSAVLFLPIIIVCFVVVLALVPTEFQSPQESSRVSDFTSSKTLYNAHSHPHPLPINCWTILSWNLDFSLPSSFGSSGGCWWGYSITWRAFLFLSMHHNKPLIVCRCKRLITTMFFVAFLSHIGSSN